MTNSRKLKIQSELRVLANLKMIRRFFLYYFYTCSRNIFYNYPAF